MPKIPNSALPPSITNRIRSVPVPCLSALDLDQQDPNKQASSVRHDAYRFAKLFGRDILHALRMNDKNRMKDQVIQWGIAADKVLSGTEMAGLHLTVPLQLVDKLVIALQSKASDAQVPDKTG